MQKQFIIGLVSKASEGKYKVLASTNAVDRQGDSIDQSGWDLTNFKLNPVMPWAHDYSALPVGKATSVQVTKLGLEAEFEFAPAEGNPMAQQVKVLYDQGYLNAVSVGFIPKTRQGNIIKSAELLEISFVPVPANQEALRLSMKSIDGNNDLDESMKSILKQVLEKGAVADELNAEEAFEAKYKNWCSMSDILSAFWSVYFDEATPVENFKTLLDEAIVLLQALPVEAPAETADEGGEATTETTDDEGDHEMRGLVAKAMTPENAKRFVAFMAKSGRTLSKKTLDSMEKAINSMKDATTVLEELKAASSDDQDGNGDTSQVEEKGTEEDTTDVPVIEEKIISLSADDLKIYRQKLVATDKNTELVLSIVNAEMRKKGIK